MARYKATRLSGAFPYFVVRAAALGGGVVSRHTDRDHADAKRAASPWALWFTIRAEDYDTLPRASKACADSPARR